jgi:Uroporphyrinogen decarboxylase (URO-D)
MAGGRALFEKFLSGEPLPRAVYVPLLRGITARVGGVPHRELTSDATLWANSLAKTAELFDLDGVVAGFHFSLLAEACGCELKWRDDRPVVGPPPDVLHAMPLEQGRLPHALEAARRMFEVARSVRGCVAAVSGPLTLAATLFPGIDAEEGFAEIKEILTAVYEAFCKIRPDVLLLMESGPLVKGETGPKLKRLYFTLKKIAAYYDVASALYIQDYRPEQVQSMAGLKMDVYILGPDHKGGAPEPEDQWHLAENAMGIGLGLPPDGNAKSRDILDHGRRVFMEKPERNFFFTSLGPVGQAHGPRYQLELVKQIHGIRR